MAITKAMITKKKKGEIDFKVLQDLRNSIYVFEWNVKNVSFSFRNGKWNTNSYNTGLL